MTYTTGIFQAKGINKSLSSDQIQYPSEVESCQLYKSPNAARLRDSDAVSKLSQFWLANTEITTNKTVKLPSSLDDILSKFIVSKSGFAVFKPIFANNFLVSLSNLYNLDEPIKILRFIDNQKPLMSLLTEAPSKIKKFFPSCKLHLKVLADAEISSWQELAIIIITELNPDEAFDSLKQLDYSWWLEASASVNLVNIHVEFE